MLSIPEALEKMLAAFAPLPNERVAIDDALGRCLAAPIASRVALPGFDNSAMDGYAVCASDLAAATRDAPVRLEVTIESRAGSSPDLRLDRGAARIFTGAPVPNGADAIVMQEDVTREGDVAIFTQPAPRSAHVRARGSDLAIGDVAVEAHTPLGPGELAMLAAQRVAAVYVPRRPIVAILSTGDELRGISDAPAPGTLVDSNSYALAAQVREAGGIARVLPPARDDEREIEARLREALQADVVVTSGGVSVGDHDLAHVAFARCGVEVGFWKVKMKPGKPILFGRTGAVPVIGLPGNPVSAFVTFEVFVRPGLRRMLGDAAPYRRRHRVRLATPHQRKPGRTELVRARIDVDGGELVAAFHPLQGSGSLPSCVGLEALVVLPEDRGTFHAGDALDALLLHDQRGARACPFVV